MRGWMIFSALCDLPMVAALAWALFTKHPITQLWLWGLSWAAAALAADLTGRTAWYWSVADLLGVAVWTGVGFVATRWPPQPGRRDGVGAA